MCPEDVGDGFAAQDRGADRLDGEKCGEELPARTQVYGMDDETALVDQAGLAQGSGSLTE
jgi:hypothetical protein